MGKKKQDVSRQGEIRLGFGWGKRHGCYGLCYHAVDFTRGIVAAFGNERNGQDTGDADRSISRTNNNVGGITAMKAQVHRRHITDTRTVLPVTLMQPNASGVDTAVNLTGLTVKFALYDSAGAVVIAATQTGVTVVTAASGTVNYDFSAGNVATAGVYYGYFIVEDSGESDHFPVNARGLKILIDGHGVTAEEADAA